MKCSTKDEIAAHLIAEGRAKAGFSDRSAAYGKARSPIRNKFVGTASALAILMALRPAPAQALPVPQADTLVSVCSGVSLPPSVVTGIIDDVVIDIYEPIELNVNQTLTALSAPLLGILGLPGSLNVDVTSILNDAASGTPISLSVLASDGSIVTASDHCDASADSFTLDTPAGVSIGGNQITGLGATGQQAVAGEIDSVAIGNRATTHATALGAIALGVDASVGTGALGSIAIGNNADATAANSVALGAGSLADRANSVSVGASGSERQIVNVAAGTQATDAVNLGQLNAVQALIPTNAVEYDDGTQAVVTLGGASGTTITNVAAGAVNATSTDAVNGSQLFAVQTQVDGIQTQVNTNTTAISNLQTSVANNTTAINNHTTEIANLTTNVAGNTTAITNLQTSVSGNTSAITNLQTSVSNNSTAITNLSVAVSNGAVGPLQYSNAGSPTVPNGGTPTNHVTLVGGSAGPVAVHNVANGVIAAGSTDAVNGGQIHALALNAVNAVTYDDSTHTSVTLNSGGPSTVVHNVAAGVLPNDAANVGQVNGAMSNAINVANSYTDMRLAELDFDIGEANREARAGTAAALAAAGMPQPIGAGRSMIAGGVGTYRGKVAVALGASHRADNGRSVFKVGVTFDSGKHVGANAGAGVEF